MESRISWDKYFMLMAKVAAIRSGCNSRPTGAVIVKYNRIIATGYNGSLPGQPQCTDVAENYCKRRSKTFYDQGHKKYQECVSIHAEQNAINQAARFGIPVFGSSVYCTLFPCIFCLKNLASVGITTVFYEIPYESNDKERDSFWNKKVEEFGISTQQILLGNEEKQKIISTVIHLTSTRRFIDEKT